eukprot:Polyplicarium_translucidae@DN3231_c1_g1_i4.p1
MNAIGDLTDKDLNRLFDAAMEGRQEVKPLCRAERPISDANGEATLKAKVTVPNDGHVVSRRVPTTRGQDESDRTLYPPSHHASKFFLGVVVNGRPLQAEIDTGSAFTVLPLEFLDGTSADDIPLRYMGGRSDFKRARRSVLLQCGKFARRIYPVGLSTEQNAVNWPLLGRDVFGDLSPEVLKSFVKDAKASLLKPRNKFLRFIGRLFKRPTSRRA